jgi:Uma2 family endonuclease
MITTSTNAEQRTLLQNISWETFESLLKETGEDRNSRFAYDCGTLEIMTPLYEHESYKIQFDRLIFTLAEELDVGIKSAGSMTLKREIVNRGIEPDNCYYIQNEPAVRNKKEFNLETDPPPDLAIEIDIAVLNHL